MKNICLIGAGNIGSRHLQALKNVHLPLNIFVIDKSQESLDIAQQRFEQIKSKLKYEISYGNDLKILPKQIDLAIIATTSSSRRKVIEDLLSVSSVEFLILEKILFSNLKDYEDMKKLLNKKVNKTWVNLSMRTQPFYYNLKEKIKGSVQMFVSGSDYGLITNTIHFIDYIAYLTNCYDFTIDTSSLDPKPIESKRNGFLELQGTLNVHFRNGSFGSFTFYKEGESPYLIQIMSENLRCISKESEKKAWISSQSTKWKWREIETKIPYQSAMTDKVVEEIFKSGFCKLPSFEESTKLHLQLIENLLKFLNKNSGQKYKSFPFT